MGAPHLDTGPMTANAFFAFTATRPDEEKWELIDGEPILNASASFLHQIITGNLIGLLQRFAHEADAKWIAAPGIGVRVSATTIHVPDVLVRSNDRLLAVECADAIIAIEVLTPTTRELDMRWKRKGYANLPSLQHYIVVAQDAVDVVSFDRANGFDERRLKDADDELALRAIDARLTLRDIYRDTGLV